LGVPLLGGGCNPPNGGGGRQVHGLFTGGILEAISKEGDAFKDKWCDNRMENTTGRKR